MDSRFDGKRCFTCYTLVKFTNLIRPWLEKKHTTQSNRQMLDEVQVLDVALAYRMSTCIIGSN